MEVIKNSVVFSTSTIKTSDNILATGCTCDSKDSALIEDLYDAGYQSIVGVDNLERNVFCGVYVCQE